MTRLFYYKDLFVDLFFRLNQQGFSLFGELIFSPGTNVLSDIFFLSIFNTSALPAFSAAFGSFIACSILFSTWAKEVTDKKRTTTGSNKYFFIKGIKFNSVSIKMRLVLPAGGLYGQSKKPVKIIINNADVLKVQHCFPATPSFPSRFQ